MKETPLPAPKHLLTQLVDISPPDMLNISFNRTYINTNYKFINLIPVIDDTNTYYISEICKFPSQFFNYVLVDKSNNYKVNGDDITFNQKGIYKHTVQIKIFPYNYPENSYKELYVCMFDIKNNTNLMCEIFTIKYLEINNYTFSLIAEHDKLDTVQMLINIVQRENIQTSIDIIKINWEIIQV
jgi:hypothetical protein